MARFNVLFICTGNSARSLMGEAVINSRTDGRFRAYSAGSHPTGSVNPVTLEVLQRARLPVEGLRSKSWDEFRGPDAPPMHFIFTVCGDAAREVCPTWPGRPITAHWIIDDPAAAEGSAEEKFNAFQRALRDLTTRINLFQSLRLEALESLALKEKLDEIGRLGESV